MASDNIINGLSLHIYTLVLYCIVHELSLYILAKVGIHDLDIFMYQITLVHWVVAIVISLSAELGYVSSSDFRRHYIFVR